MKNQGLKTLGYGILSFFLLFIYPHSSFASCTGVFLAPVQSNCGSVSSNCNTGNASCGCVTLKGSATINGNPVGSPPGSQLPSPSVSQNGAVSCNSGVSGQPGNNSYACSGTGVPSSQISPGAFQATSCTTSGCNVTVSSGTVTLGGSNKTDYGNIVVNGGTLVFTADNAGSNSTLYRMNNLTINGGTVQFAPGDYWIAPTSTSSNLSVASSGVTFTSSAPGVIRMLVGNDISWAGGSGFPAISSGSAVLVFDYGNITMQGSGTYTGLFYAVQDIDVGGSETINGAVSGGTVSAAHGSPTINYNSTLVSILDSSTGACGGDHFALTYANTGARCQPWNLTVTMTQSDGTIDTNYGTSVAYPKTISLQVIDPATQNPISAGTWSTTGKGTLTAGSNTGAAQYTFAQATGSSGDQGVVNFQLSYPTGQNSIDVLISTVNDPSIVGTATAGPITFTTETFTVSLPTPVTAGQAATATITAVAAPSCVPLSSYTGTKNIQLWTQYLNPTMGTMAATVNGSTVTNCQASGSPSYAACSAGATTQSLTFSGGVATVSFQYPDVGTIALNAADTSKGGPSGQSSNTVVVPAQFVVTNFPGTCNAAAVSTLMTAPYFQKAGAPFSATVQVQNAQGSVTPNFGNETPAEVVKLLPANLIAPVGGRDGSKNDGNVSANVTVSKTSPGIYQLSSVNFDEVGIITLQAGTASGSYQGMALTSTQEPQTGCVGRFVPDHFTLTQKVAPVFATGCTSGGFNYVGQPISYQTSPIVTVTADAVAGTVTQNYTNFYSGYQFWRLDPTQTPALGSISQTYAGGAFALAAYPGGFPTAAVNAAFKSTNTSFTAGTDTGIGARDYTFSFTPGSGIQFPKLTGGSGQVVPGFTGEVSFSINVTDADGITTTAPLKIGDTTTGNGITFANAGKTFYQGRMSLVNTFGSELLPLAIPITLQYYDGVTGNWLVNAADNCTSMPNVTPQSKIINAIVAGQGTGSSGTLTTTPSLSGSTFTAGVITLNLSSPGKGNTGYVDVSPDLTPTGYNLPWLQYDWPQAGAPTKQYSNNPFGRGTFGIYKGSGNIIFRQRVVQ